MALRPLAILAVAGGLALAPGAAQAARHTQTLRFFDKPVSIQLTHPDGTVVTHAPYPEARPGDVLDVNSLDYRGNRRHHSRHWIASTHLRCVFGTGEPACESHLAIRGSMLVFTGNPGIVSNGTGIYHGATGRVVSAKQFADGTSNVVAKIRLRR